VAVAEDIDENWVVALLLFRIWQEKPSSPVGSKWRKSIQPIFPIVFLLGPLLPQTSVVLVHRKC